MDYNLKHKILLEENTEDRDGYPWSLKEDVKEGDFIPLRYENLYFTASELRHHYSFQVNTSDSDNEETGTETESTERESIIGVLQPGYCRDGKTLNRETRYSMFGTDRIIKDFNLHISKCKSSNDKSKCLIRGLVGYTSEGEGFIEETKDDSIWIELTLAPQQFIHVSELIKSKHVDILEITLCTPCGFYYKWSPAPSWGEYYIKILANEKYQKVVTPDGCKINPPRLGGDTDFDMSITQRHMLNPKQDLSRISIDELFYDLEEDETEKEKEEIQESKQNDKISSILSGLDSIKGTLAFPLWMIFIILCLKFIILQ